MLSAKWRPFCLSLNVLNHWGRVTHICVGNLTVIGSDNGLSSGRRQAIIWTSAGILFIRPLGTNLSEILLEMHTFSFTKMHSKMYAHQGSVWTEFDPGESCVWQIEKGKAWYRNTIVYRVNRMRWVRKVCVDIRALLRLGYLQQFWWMVSTDPVGVWNKYANRFDGVVSGGSSLVDVSRWSQSLVGDVSATEFVICATLKRLTPSAVLKLVCCNLIVISLSTMVRP